MSKKDYTKFSAPNHKERPEKIQNGISETKTAAVAQEQPKPKVVETPKKETPKPVIGVVTNCLQLRVRENPSTEADIICEIPCLTELSIDKKESTEDFYKVSTSDGVHGFCMKKFVVIRKEQ